MKKAVNLGFLDFSTLEKRRHYCEEEVRLNSRFSPDTYLATIPVCDDNGTVRLGPPGNAVEYLVKMQRLPEELMLHTLLRDQNAGLVEKIAALGHRLASLHTEALPCNHDEGYSDLMHVRRNWDENFRQIEPFAGNAISPEGLIGLRTYVHTFLEKKEARLEQREKAGWVRECHGDLHAGHVCMTDPIRIFDCIEFNRRFRVSDIICDLAFLLMDLDRHHRHDLAAILQESYAENLNAAVPDDIVRFYKVYRAVVRGKVAAILNSEETVPSGLRVQARKDALDYFNLALGYLAPQALLITCGLMGTGKTTLARALAPVLDAEVIRSDEVRMQFKEHPSSAIQSAFLQGPYRPELTEMVYRQMAVQVRHHLRNGRTVLVDASFAAPAQRRMMQELAIACNVPFVVLLSHCPRDLAKARLAERVRHHTDISDGRPELYDLQAANFSLPASHEPVIMVDTENNATYSANSVLGRLSALLGKPLTDH